MRNPKDVCVSYFHYGRLVEGWRVNLEDYIEVFLADKGKIDFRFNIVFIIFLFQQ